MLLQITVLPFCHRVFDAGWVELYTLWCEEQDGCNFEFHAKCDNQATVKIRKFLVATLKIRQTALSVGVIIQFLYNIV